VKKWHRCEQTALVSQRSSLVAGLYLIRSTSFTLAGGTHSPLSIKASFAASSSLSISSTSVSTSACTALKVIWA